MSAHETSSAAPSRPASRFALIVATVTVAVTGAGWLWALLVVPFPDRDLAAWGGGSAVAVLTAAAAAVAYFAESARQARSQIAAAGAEATQLKRELSELVLDTVPFLVAHVRDGAQPDAVLGQVRPPASEELRALLGILVQEIGAAQRRAADAAAAIATLERAATVFVQETLPAVITRMRDGEAADLVLTDVARPVSVPLQGLLEAVVGEVGSAQRRSAAAMAACASAAARLQAQTMRMLAELRELENRYGDDKVFADLMELDHRVSQLGRLADSIGLLSGGRSGRRWTKPIMMESILRGAMGRIDAYRRVRLHSASSAAIAGYAAEGVMQALAELMDNAASFSAHGSEVHVYVEDEDAGAVVTIEDGGLGMRRRERQRAEELVSQPRDLTTLPGTRLGLAVVGRLADRYGLTVNFRPSSRGGTGVVVMIPRPLITHPGLAVDPDPATLAGRPVRAPAPAPAAREPVPSPAGSGPGPDGDLPVRPRGATLAAAARSRPDRTTAPVPAPRDASARFAAFRQAGERNRPAPPDGGGDGS
jgi:signal transduction histidine kinase